MRFGLQKLTLLDYPGRVACTLFCCGCNFRCPFCHNAALVTGRDEEMALDRDGLFSFLSSRAKILDGVAVTGGEPLLQPEIPEVIREIKSLGFAVKLDTNGSFPEILEKLIANPRRKPIQIKLSHVQMTTRSSSRRTDRHDRQVSLALDLIREQATAGLSSRDVLENFSCSRRLAEQRFKAIAGRTILDEIHAVQVEHAKKLIAHPFQKLSTIPQLCGHPTAPSFQKLFKRIVGVTMSEFRRQLAHTADACRAVRGQSHFSHVTVMRTENAAAFNRNVNARDETGLIRRKEDNGTGHLVRRTLATNPCSGRRLDLAARDHSGRNAIDGNALLGVLHRERLCKHDHPGFRRRVVGIAGKPRLPCNRCQVDDAAIPVLQHFRQNGLSDMEYTVHVDVEKPLPFGGIHLLEPLTALHVPMFPDTRVIDKYIDLSERGLGCGNRGEDTLTARHIHRESANVRTFRHKRRHPIRNGFGLQIASRNPNAMRGQPSTDSMADIARRTRHKRNAIVE